MTINDPDKLSRKPSQIRRRLRRTVGDTPDKRARLDRDLAILHEVDPRYRPIDEWDWEELARGRPRNKSGTFGGASPSWLDAKLREEAKRRLREKVSEHLGVYARTALRVLQRTMVDETVDVKTRIETAKFVIEHVIGKATVRQEIKSEGAIGFIARALVLDDPDNPGQYISADPWIDGEVVDDDDDDDGE